MLMWQIEKEFPFPSIPLATLYIHLTHLQNSPYNHSWLHNNN